MREHLRSGTMGDPFYKTIFDWDDIMLQEAIKRANEVLERAGLKLTENLCRIRFEKGTQMWTQGARRRLTAEADLMARSSDSDGLFDLAHERSDSPRPAWLKKDMMYTGRKPNTMYDFPTIVQKFFQHAREQAKGNLKQETAASTHLKVSPPTPAYVTQRHTSSSNMNGITSKTGLNGVHLGDIVEPSRPHLDEADVHVGWVLQQDDGSLVLEKDFRSLRKWLDGPDSWHYNFDEIRRSLRMIKDSQLQLFWFENLAGQPWVVKDDHAIAGAVERMHSEGKICFILARDIEHVRALTRSQRGEYNEFLVSSLSTAANVLTEIEKQTAQILTLYSSAPLPSTRKSQTLQNTSHNHIGHPARRQTQAPYNIPGISVSLAKILGEQVMRSRVEYDERRGLGIVESNQLFAGSMIYSAAAVCRNYLNCSCTASRRHFSTFYVHT